MLLIGASSDRRRERRWHIIVPFLMGAAAMAATTFFSHNVFATVLLFAIASATIIGAVVGGWIGRNVGFLPPDPNPGDWLPSLGSVVTATVGAMIVLLLWKWLRK